MVRLFMALMCAAIGAAAAMAQEPAGQPPAPPPTPAAAPAQAAAGTPPAAQPAQAAPSDDTAAVQQALGAYVQAFNAHDANVLAALWTPTGTHVNNETGARTAGREQLLADFTALFARSPNISLSGHAQEIRVIGGDTALVDGVSTVVTPDSDPAASAYSAVFVKQDGKWLLDTIYESDLPVPETPRQALAPLEWMVGLWQDESDTATVTSTMRWSPSEAFLIRSYDVDREGEEPFQGQQIIGWDPAVKQIRSWTFNSDGSFGEANWSQNGAEWIVRKVETLADGRLASGTQVITQIDGSTITVQTIAKEVDGAPEPTAEPVTMKRIAETEGPAVPDNAAPAAAPAAGGASPGAGQ
jgi:uncharacterized protein (TIGR02246 family)